MFLFRVPKYYGRRKPDEYTTVSVGDLSGSVVEFANSGVILPIHVQLYVGGINDHDSDYKNLTGSELWLVDFAFT